MTFNTAIRSGEKKGFEEGMQKGLETGLEKGRLEERARAEAEKLKSALNFKKMGIPIEEIAEGLGLTVEQVEKLK